MLICLDAEQRGPLGIHVMPFCSDAVQCDGLIIHEIEPNGRIDRDGRFSVGDRIIEVNEQTLLNVSYDEAQVIIGQALHAGQVRLKVVKNSRLKTITSASINSVESLQTRPSVQVRWTFAKTSLTTIFKLISFPYILDPFNFIIRLHVN